MAKAREGQNGLFVVVGSELNGELLVFLLDFCAWFGALQIDVSRVGDFFQGAIVEFVHGAGDFEVDVVSAAFFSKLFEGSQKFCLLLHLVAERI